MKPCPAHRESVALLAGGAVSTDVAEELRRHLDACAGCREYFRQVAAVCHDHATAARHLPDAEVSSRLRSRIVASIRVDSERRSDPLFAGLIRWGPIGGVAALLVLWVVSPMVFRKPMPPVPVAGTPAPLSARTANPPAPSVTLITYRLALNRSPEDLEALLAHHAARPAFNSKLAFRVGLSRLDPEL